ncbi:MAG: hypothetical protein ACR2MQ_11455 [Gemmatimonadaceae bacterium]
MTAVSPHYRELARELLDYEARAADGTPLTSLDPVAVLTAGDRVLAKMRDHLSRWFGTEGFEALLKRALSRTQSQYPFLIDVMRVSSPDDRTVGFVSQTPGEDHVTVTEGLVAMFATLIAQISRLLGEDMATHFVGQIWPDIKRVEPRAHVETVTK